MKTTKSKIALFHAFFKNRGGAEKFLIILRDFLKADIFVGGIRSDIFSPDFDDSFSQELFKAPHSVTSLHEDAKLPVWRHIKRQLYFLFSPKIRDLSKYEAVIFTGNVFWVSRRLKRLNPDIKIIAYVHTPPRIFADQKQEFLSQYTVIVRPFLDVFGKLVLYFFRYEVQKADLIIANSQNIQIRVKKYLQIDSYPIFPPIETKKFTYRGTEDFFLSYARLEDLKRIRLIFEAFAAMPDQKLVICSTGPLKDWVIGQIQERNITNIVYEGLVSDERLQELVGTCRAGVFVPVEEDAGITQCEIMAAGKPVLGVAEGGLLETVIHKKTGFLAPPNPSITDIQEGVAWLTLKKSIAMKEACITQAKKFDEKIFFDKLSEKLSTIGVTHHFNK